MAEWIKWLAIALAAIGGGFLIWYAMWREDFEGLRSASRYRRDLANREPMDEEAFFEHFYAGSRIDKELVYRFLRFQADFWSVPVELIRPHDDYNLIMGDGDADDFISALEREFSIHVSNDDCQELNGTFDSLVRFLASKLVQA